MKKSDEDKNIFNMHTINDNHMMYRSWGMEHNRQNFLLIWTIFALLPH